MSSNTKVPKNNYINLSVLNDENYNYGLTRKEKRTLTSNLETNFIGKNLGKTNIYDKSEKKNHTNKNLKFI